MLLKASKKQRHGLWQKTLIRGILPIFVLGLLTGASIFTGQPNRASALTASTLNFQGRLRSNTGSTVPDGSYNIEFNLYTVATGGTTEWTETHTNLSTNAVTVQNGYFSVDLGNATTGTVFPGTINWDQEHWLGMTVRGNGAACAFAGCTPADLEMTPRFKLTAVPYAFRAGALVDASGNAKTADQFAQISPGAVQAANSAVAALRLSQAGAGGFVQFQNGGNDVFTVDNNGGTTLGSSTAQGQLSLQDGNGQRTNFVAGDSITDLTFTFPTTLGTAQQCLKNGATPGLLEFGTCGSSAVMPFVSKTKTADETQNNAVNPTATLQNDDQLFFSIGANETWNYRFVLHANANATPDIKFAVTAPVGATCQVGAIDAEGAAAVGNLGCGTSTGLITGNTANDIYEVTGSITNGANAGTVQLQWAQNTANVANTIVRSGSYVEASRSVGGSSADVAFIQDGNSFGGLATIGTNDVNDFALETNGVERLRLLSGGDIRASDDLIANRVATGTTGTTTGTGTNITTLTLTADVFAVNDVVLIDNVGQDYYTRITVDPGTGSYTVSPAVTFATGRTVTKYTVQNVGATEVDYASPANRFFQGYFLGGVVVGAGSTTISDGNIESTTDLNLQANGGNVVVGGGLSVTGAITGDGSGLININGASITGSTITGLDASNVATGTLNDGRLSANVAFLSGAQTFMGAKDFSAGLTVSAGNVGVTGNVTASGAITGATIVGDGSGLTNLDAADIASGTLNDARLSSNVALLTGSQTFSGAKTFSGGVAITAGNLNVTGTITASGVISGDGSGLTNLSGASVSGSSITGINATNISTGTLNDGRLSANVALLSGAQTFTGAKDFSAGLTVSAGNIGVTGNVTASAQISGATILGDGSGLTNLDAADIASGTINDGRLSGNVALLSGAQTFSGAKTFSGGIVLGQTTLSSAATVARAVSFPDDAGTVCLSNKDTCGYLRIASGAVQTDASNNDVMAVNKTSATGNLINLQRSATPVFTVANTGALQIQSSSTAALDIRNGSGSSYFLVDTSGAIVRIGSGATDVMLILDSKTSAGDPTGQEGAMYYSNTMEQYRCYRDGVWEPCGSNPVDRAWSIEDEFMSGYTGGACSTTTSIVGDINWACYTSGTATTAYNVGAILPTADRPGIMRLKTGAANGNGFTIAATGNNTGSMVLAADQRVQASVGQGAAITNNRLRVGLHAETTTNVRPTTGVWWEADATTNANWNYCFGTGAAATCASSGVPIVASTIFSLDIRITATGAGTSAATFSINGTSFNVTNVTISTATRVNPAMSCFNSTAAARECFIDYFRASGTATARR